MKECSLLLSNIFLQDEVENKWDWSLDPGKGYSVRGAYNLLSSMVQNDRSIYYDYVWNKAASLKVSLLLWKLRLNHLPKHRRYSTCFRHFLEWLWS